MAKASGDESQGEGGGESGETGSTGNGSRDPETGEGMWMDDEDEVRQYVTITQVCRVSHVGGAGRVCTAAVSMGRGAPLWAGCVQ